VGLLLEWITGMDYWSDIFLVFTHFFTDHLRTVMDPSLLYILANTAGNIPRNKACVFMF